MATVSAAGTRTYSFINEPTQLTTAYPYTAPFAIGMDAKGAIVVQEASITVHSTPGVPTTYAQYATTAVAPSNSSTTSVTASATVKSGAANKAGVGAAALLGLLAPILL